MNGARRSLACALFAVCAACGLRAEEPAARDVPIFLFALEAQLKAEPRGMEIRLGGRKPQALPFRRPVQAGPVTQQALVASTTQTLALDAAPPAAARLSCAVSLFAAGAPQEIRAGKVRFSVELRSEAGVLALSAHELEVRAGEVPDGWAVLDDWKPAAEGAPARIVLRTQSFDAEGRELPPSDALPAPLGVLAAWGAPVVHAADARAKPPGIFLIAFDTLRANRLGCYGYAKRKTSPAFDALAAKGYLFERCTSPTSWTLPAFQALLTGLHPAQLGYAQESLRDPTEEKFAMLRYGRAENLPHLLHKERRWLALAATGGGMLEPWQHNFLKGFARILSNKSLDPVGRGDGRFTQAQINALWLREGVAEFPAAPLFGFYHTYEPHAPYHDARFAEGLPRGRVAVPFNEGNYLAGGQKALTADYSAEEQAFIGALYDGDVAASDAALDELLRLPGGGSLLDRGWLIVTSDHGEEFWDHGGMSHGHSLYEELLHVPLLIVPPGGLETGVRIAEPVSLLDLFPTACELAGLAPPPNLLGRSLKPLLSPDAEARAKVQLPAPPGLFVHCATYHGPTRWAIRRGNWKYILSLDVETWKKDEANRRMLRLEPEELYDLALDPREEKNLIAEKECAEVRKQLADALALLRATVLKPLELSPDRQAVQPPPLDPALLEQLKKLGY